MKTVLITGVHGFVGQHLRTAIEQAGLEPVSFDGDIRERPAIAARIAEVSPDGIVHLAALASVAASWGAEHDVWETNATGTHNLVPVGTQGLTLEIFKGYILNRKGRFS